MNSQEYFNTIAPQWNHMRTAYFSDDVRPIIFKHFDPSHKVIADFGSGTGFLALSVAKLAKVVIAIDQSTAMLKQLQNQARQDGIDNIIGIQHDLQHALFIDKTLHAITMNMALHHIKDPLKLLKSMYEGLDDGGELIISDVMKHNGTWAHEEMLDEWLGFSEFEMRTWLQEAGFSHIQFINTQILAHATSTTGHTISPSIFVAIARKEEKHAL